MDPSPSVTASTKISAKYGAVATPAPTPAPSSASPTSVSWFFVFVCISTMVRFIESGIVAAMMEPINHTLHMSHVIEGQLVAAPCYGLVIGAAIAPGVFQHAKAHHVITMAQFGIVVAMAISCIWPRSLPIIRGVEGIFWGFNAAHYPAWINHYAPEDKRTMWMAICNTATVGGIILGFALGSYTTRFWVGEKASWIILYALNALLTLLCAIWNFFFSSDTLQVVKFNDETLGTVIRRRLSSVRFTKTVFRSLFPDELTALFKEKFYIFNLIFGCSLGGGVQFLLYFIKELVEKAIHVNPVLASTAVLAIAALAPIPGGLIGAAVLSRMGGYQDIKSAYCFMAVATIVTVIFFLLLILATWKHNTAGFIIFFFFLALFATAPAPANIGIGVSTVPRKSATYASGVQFSLMQISKIIVPTVGGVATAKLGMVAGFFTILAIVIGIAASAAMLGFGCALWKVDKLIDP